MGKDAVETNSLNELILAKKLGDLSKYIETSNPDEIKRLLKLPDSYGDIPLHIMHSKGIDIARTIFNLYKEHGLLEECYDFVNKYNETPFYYALNTTDDEVRSMIFGDVNVKENRDFFMRHVRREHFDKIVSNSTHNWEGPSKRLASYLLYLTADKSSQTDRILRSVDKDGNPFIFLFLESDNWIDSLEILLKYDATLLLQPRKYERAYPMHVVCKHPFRCEESIKLMVKYGGLHLLDYVDSHNKTARKYFQHHNQTYDHVMKWLETNLSPEILNQKLADNHTVDETKEVSANEILPFCALGCCIAGLNCDFPSCVGCRLRGSMFCLDSDIISCKMAENPAHCCLLLKGSTKCLSSKHIDFCKFSYQCCCIDALCLFPPILVTDTNIPCMCTACGLTVCYRYTFGLFCLRRLGEIKSAVVSAALVAFANKQPQDL